MTTMRLLLLALCAGCGGGVATVGIGDAAMPPGSTPTSATDGGTALAQDGGGSTADAGNAGTSTGACKYAANKTGLNAYQQAGGLAFHVYAPSSYDASVAHTVIVIMHGQDSDGTAELQDLWQPIADQEQLILLAPKGSGASTDPTAYPNGANWQVDDLNAIQDLVGEIDDCYSVDRHKHILWGFSEGAFYGYLLGIGAADQFSGLAMGGANTGFAQQYGYPPSAEQWKIPVSHVQGTTDPNGMAPVLADQMAFEAAGSTFTLYQPNQGHTITQAQVAQQYEDLKDSVSPETP